MTLIDHGLASLAKRVELIETAKKSIELEFFIYDLDLASRYLSLKLIEASKRGVKIKILVDFSIAVFKLAPEYVAELIKAGIEVRYYNTASTSAIVSMQHRNHRKFLIIDGKKAFTGGRNIANDYFDLSDHYNFLDSDILIDGEIVSKIRKSFFLYWESKFASLPQISGGQGEEIFFKWSKEAKRLDRLLKNQARNLNQLNIETTCHDIAFVTDFPGVSPTNRQVYRRIEQIARESEKRLIIESPYLVLKSDGFDLLSEIKNKGVDVIVNTNSLASTDAYYTVSALWSKLQDLRDAKITVNLYQGDSPSYLMAKKTRYGIHSKRAVIDGKHTLIGTYNIDPRSANLNSEVLIVCRNNEKLALAVEESLKFRTKNSRDISQFNSNIKPLINGANSLEQLKFFMAIPLVYFFDFLL